MIAATKKDPEMSATRSHPSPDLPACIACCRISVMIPNTDAITGANHSIGAVFFGQPWRRFQSRMMQRVKPPNIIACTILSAPGKRGMSLSGSGCGARVSQHIARKQTTVSVQAGNFSSQSLILSVFMYSVYYCVSVGLANTKKIQFHHTWDWIFKGLLSGIS